MLDITSLSTKNRTEIKSMGIYQIVGGGLGLVFLIFSGPTIFLSTYVIGELLFGFSIYSGLACFKFKSNCLNLTFINQLLQVFSVLIDSFTFEYSSGAGLSLTIDTSDSLIFGFDFNLSTISAGFFDEGGKYYFGFNLIALYIIYLTEKIKKDIRPKT